MKTCVTTFHHSKDMYSNYCGTHNNAVGMTVSLFHCEIEDCIASLFVTYVTLFVIVTVTSAHFMPVLHM